MGMKTATQLLSFVTTDSFGFAAASFIAACLIGILKTINDLTSFYIQHRMTTIINTDLFARVVNTNLQKHQIYEYGYLNTRIMSDSWAFEALARNLIPSISNDFLRLFASIIILSAINMKMLLVCIVAGLLMILTSCFFSKKVRHLAGIEAEEFAASQSFVQKSLYGIETIKAHNLENTRIKGFLANLEKLTHTRQKFLKTRLASTFVVRGVQFCCIMLLMIMAENLYRHGDLSAGDIIVFASYLGLMTGPVTNLALLHLNLQPILVAVSRVEEILNFPGETEATFEEPDKEKVFFAEFPEKLILKSICYEHSPEGKVFKDLNLEFCRGKPAIIGWHSGVGKTTLARLLLKFLHPDSGQILLDGIPYTTINTTKLRRNSAYKPQADFFFAGTIRENLLVARPEASETEITEALRLCCADDFVFKKRGNLEFYLQDGANNISEGQRQRLALVRAILRNPALLILDEPFAAIDSHTADKIMKNLHDFFSQRICIIMSHKKVAINSEEASVVEKEL